MITFKTLHSATLQELFDHVAKHLLAQNKAAKIFDADDGTACFYRTAEGRSCAVGCCMADDEYSYKLENIPMRRLAYFLNPNPIMETNYNIREKHAADFAMKAGWYGAGIRQDQIELLIALQEMHDDYNPDPMYPPSQYIFDDGLETVAERFELTYDRSKYVS